MWAIAFAMVAIFLLSNLPTPLYEGYREAFGFSELTLTLVYAAYVVGSMATLFFLGRLSDQVGRRPVLLGAVGLAIVSAVGFLFTTGTLGLFLARIASGFAVALASGAGTAWILELHPEGDKAKGTQIALVANSVGLGLGLGPLLSGLLAEYAPWPLHLSYLVILPVLVAVGALAFASDDTVRERPLSEASVKPRLGVPKDRWRGFVTPAIAAFVTFALLGFYSSLLPSVVTRTLHLLNRAVSGGVVALLFLVSALSIATWPQVKPRRGMLTGLWLLVPGVALLVLAEAVHSLAWLLVGTAIGGVAAGLGYRFGLQRVNELSPDDRHAELISSYLVVCYVAISLPVIGVGLVSSATGSLFADALFGGLIVALAIAALAFELRPSRRP
jgi:MFS family permease